MDDWLYDWEDWLDEPYGWDWFDDDWYQDPRDLDDIRYFDMLDERWD